MLSVITRESDRVRNPWALGIFLKAFRRVEIYCGLGGTVQAGAGKFFNGKLLAKLEKAILKGEKFAEKAKNSRK